jgi:hypothetical protein
VGLSFGEAWALNTPSQKKPVRYSRIVPGIDHSRTVPNGDYVHGLEDAGFAAAVCDMVTQWAHLEETMIEVLEALLGGHRGAAARQIFRSINSAAGRIKVMRSLLEASPLNQAKGPIYDQFIDEFQSLTTIRNNYAHGLWYTGDKGNVLLANPDAPDNPVPFLTAYSVSFAQVQHNVSRVSALTEAILKELVIPAIYIPPSHPTPSSPLSEDD